MEVQVVAIEVRPNLEPGAVSFATGLALGAAGAAGAAPLILSTAAVAPKHRVTVALGDRVLEAQVLTTATVERSTEAFSSLASRGWRCGSTLEPATSCRLQLLLLRPVGTGSPAARTVAPSQAPRLTTTFAEPQSAWIGRRVALHWAPFGRANAALHGAFARVVMQGVVSNISSPPGLLMSDVHVAESCAGAAMVLDDTNEVVALMAPCLRSSSGESVALSLAVPMSMILDTLLDNDACRDHLKRHELAQLEPSVQASLQGCFAPCEVLQGVALLWLESGSWASAIVLSPEGHLLTCAHLLTSLSWMEGLPLSGRSTAQQCRGRCYTSQEGEIVSTTFEADVLQIFEGCLDAALLLVRPRHGRKAARFNPTLWQRRASEEELVQGIEVAAVGYGLFGPGCPWEGPAITSGQLCKVVYSLGPPRRCAVLQSSAAVHRGCSGGALVAGGRLLGMVTTNVKQQDGSVMPHVNFILPVTLLTPICTYLENLKLLPAEQALKRLTEELRGSAASSEEQSLWRLETEQLELPSRMLARKRHALRRLDELQKEAEEEVQRQEDLKNGGAAGRSKL